MNDKPTTADAETKTTKAVKGDDKRVACITILKTGTAAKGFTFAKGATVTGVPLAHATFLQEGGEAKITEVKG